MTSGHDSALPNPPPDGLGRLVWHVDRVVRAPENLMNFLASTAILFLMVLGVVQIGLRLRQICLPFTELCIPLLNAPIFGYIDMIELAMPILAILGISYCQRLGTHIRMDILIQRFDGRLLWSVETFAALMTLIIAILLMIFSWNFFADAYQIGDSTTDAEIDTWPSKLLVPIAFALLVCRTVVQTLGAFRLAIDPRLTPVGVVVQKDIAEQAQEEIREALGDADGGTP
ncbi:MAG: TRAP transporter small permease subunit [Xanthomonadales bacterium]|nr:TRAP transporter small permease subunit [Xanthomonadales bacterium]